MIGSIIALSVRHRWVVAVLTLGLAVWGSFELTRLPIDAVPDITNRQVVVTTLAPALSPEEMERRVTFPLETALAGIPGLEGTRSISRNGFSQITAVFTDGTDVYFARNQVNERLGGAAKSLPPGIEPALSPITTGLGEVFMWTLDFAPPVRGARTGAPGSQRDGSYVTPEGERLVSDMQKATYLRTVQDWMITPQLRTVPGVASIEVVGGYEKEYSVRPDPSRLAAYGIGLTELVDALERANVAAGGGYVFRGAEGFVIRADARARSAADLGASPISERNGLVVRVSDVAVVVSGQTPRLGAASKNGHETVLGSALMLTGENSRVVARLVGQRLSEIAPSLPSGIVATPALDRTKLVDSTIHTVQRSLAEGALLVVAVLFLLLGNVRAAIITALVIPLAFLFGVIGMNRLGISGNLMSLGALDFGLLVDGAVVVVENTLRKLAQERAARGRMLTRSERLEQAVAAAREMIRPAGFGQAIILLVYAPLLALEGVEGKMFHPMAATVMLVLAGAFVINFTFVPAVTALFVRDPKGHGETKADRVAQRHVEPVIRRAVARPAVVAIGAGAALLIGLTSFFTLGREFIPTLDEHDIMLEVLRPPSVSIEQSAQMQLAVERAALRVPEVAAAFSRTGTSEIATDPMPVNKSDGFVMLRPRSQWPDPDLPKSEVREKIEAETSRLLGNAFEFTQPIQMRFNELIAGVRTDIAVSVYGDNFTTLQRTAERIANALRRVPGAADVRVEQVSGAPTLNASIDRSAAAIYGLSAADVTDAIQIALGGREAGQVFEGDRRFAVRVRLGEDARSDLAAIAQVPVVGRNGGTVVPLSTVARFEITEGLNQISRENGKRRIVVQANVRGRDLGGFVQEAQTSVAREAQLPPGVWLDWGGQFENLQRAEQRLAIVIPVVFLIIALLLYLALGSVAEAALVFLCVPLALVGGVLALLLRGMPFSVSAAVGLIAVSGVATLNGLVLMQAINQRLARGFTSAVAAVDGSLSRLRAVLTTALVAILGFVPMAIAQGAGAEVQKPIATVVIGGLLTATVLTLVVLPTFAAQLLKRVRSTPEKERQLESVPEGATAG